MSSDSASARRTGRRLIAGARSARRYLARHPAATALGLFLLGTSLSTGSLWGADASIWGTGPSEIGEGRWWTVLTALLVPDSTIDTAIVLALAVTVFAYAESLLGHRRVLVVAAVSGTSGTLIAMILHSALWSIDALRPWETQDLPVMDPAIALVGAVMASTAFASALWRRRLRLVGFAVLVMFALYAGDADAWYRLASAVVGLGIGLWLARGRPRRHWQSSTVRETRALAAALVSVTALGPFAAIVAGGGRGPLSSAVTAFEQYDQHIIDRCNASYVPQCDHQLALLVTRGLGPALLALVPIALLLVAAWGLRRGRRAGLVLAITVEGALAGLAVLALATGDLYADPWGDGTVLEYLLWAMSSIGVPAVTVIVLLVLRRRFPLRSTRRAARDTAALAGGAFLLCAGGFAASQWMLRSAYENDPGIVDLLVEAVRRLVPPAFLQGIAQTPYPRHGAALAIYQWVGVLFWIVVIAATLMLYHRVQPPEGTDGRLYRALLRRGGGTLSALGTWRGNDYWYSPDRQSAIAYRLVGEVALAVGDPLTLPANRADTMRGFIEFCRGRAWTPVFYSIHDKELRVLEDLGWSHIPVGVETVIATSEFTLAGKSAQKVRHPVTRAERDGVRAVWTRWDDLTEGQLAEITEIDEQWIADKALPEMGFTLGSLEEVKDPDVELLLAVDALGRIQVVTSWLPSWRDGRLSGWTLDFMRRRADGPNGLMEFVIAKAALRARDEGIAELSLSGAPLATPPGALPGSDAPVVRSVLEWLAIALEPAYGFGSLFRFKAKFRPEYRPIHLAYQDPVELPQIGVAIGRAYLPEASARDLLAIARSVRTTAQ